MNKIRKELEEYDNKFITAGRLITSSNSLAVRDKPEPVEKKHKSNNPIDIILDKMQKKLDDNHEDFLRAITLFSKD